MHQTQDLDLLVLLGPVVLLVEWAWAGAVPRLFPSSSLCAGAINSLSLIVLSAQGGQLQEQSCSRSRVPSSQCWLDLQGLPFSFLLRYPGGAAELCFGSMFVW